MEIIEFNEEDIVPVQAVYFDIRNKLPIFALKNGNFYAPVFLHGDRGVEMASFEKISLN